MSNRGKNKDNITTPAQNTSVETPQATTKRRHYRHVTANDIARFTALKTTVGNGAKAVREMYGDEYADDRRRAWLISTKANTLNVSDYVENKVQQIALEAVERLQELVQSPDEQIATKNVHYTLDRQGGKAVQRTESKQITLNIDAILS